MLDVYHEIGEGLPILSQWESLDIDKSYMGKILELIYVDILEFHQEAYKFFKLRSMLELF